MPSVIFILSLPKSGSTVLDLLLGTHASIVGLGEIYQLIRDDSIFLKESTDPLCACSCGAQMNDCSFWREVVTELQASPQLVQSDRYRVVMKHFSDAFGENMIAVDSSKNVEAFGLASATVAPNIKAIVLIRDVRAWTTSRLVADEENRMRALQSKGFSKRTEILRRGAFALFRQWYSDNQRLLRVIRRTAVDRIEISYEQLCFDSNATMARLFEFIGVDSKSTIRPLVHSQSHNILGNRMRLQNEKRMALRYDVRWMAEKSWTWPSILLPRIMQFNRTHVYPQDWGSIWSS